VDSLSFFYRLKPAPLTPVEKRQKIIFKGDYMQRLAGIVIATAVATSSWGQILVSSKAGMIHHVDGQVLLDGKPFQVDKTRSATIPEGKVLETQNGRAEVLLAPGTFLRLADNSSIQMVSSDVADISLELLSGVTLIEVVQLRKDSALQVKTGKSTTQVLDKGLYSFDADSAVFRVFEGKAQVSLNGNSLVVTKGRQTSLGTALAKDKFDAKNSQDGLYLWSQRRSFLLASANASAVRNGSYASTRSNYGQWLFDPYLGVITYLPTRGYYGSPFGVYYYGTWRDYQNAMYRSVNTDSSYSASNSNAGSQAASLASSASSSAAAAASVVAVAPTESRPSSTASAPVEVSGARSR